MATIIDSLLVTLGLDDAEFHKHRKGVDDGLDRTREAGKKTAEELADATTKMGLGFSKLRGEVIGLFLAFAGAKGLTDFLTNVTKATAALGQNSAILGVNINQLNAWQDAAIGAQGDAADAVAAFSTINEYYADFTRHPEIIGQNGKLFNQLGLEGKEKDFSDPNALLLDLAGQFDKEMARAKASGDTNAPHRTLATFVQRLKEFGITSKSIIDLITNGQPALKKQLDYYREQDKVTKADADAAREFNTQLSDLERNMWSLVRGPLTAFLKIINVMLNDWASHGLNLGLHTGNAHPKSHPDADGHPWWWYWLPHVGSGPDTGPPPGGDGGKDGPAAPMMYQGSLAANGGKGRDAGTALRYLLNAGIPMEAAAGLTATIVAEGGLTNRTGGGYQHRAVGVGQLLGDRRTEFLKKYGNNFTFENELEFMVHELKGGRQKGDSVIRAGSRDAALVAAVKNFFRPREGYETARDIAAGRAFLARFNSAQAKKHRTNITVHVHANGHSDPHKIAHKTGQAVKKALAGGSNVVNANSGIVG